MLTAPTPAAISLAKDQALQPFYTKITTRTTAKKEGPFLGTTMRRDAISHRSHYRRLGSNKGSGRAVLRKGSRIPLGSEIKFRAGGGTALPSEPQARAHFTWLMNGIDALDMHQWLVYSGTLNCEKEQLALLNVFCVLSPRRSGPSLIKKARNRGFGRQVRASERASERAKPRIDPDQGLRWHETQP